MKSLKDVLLSDLSALKLLLGVIATTLGTGFIVADAKGGAYDYLLGLAPVAFWSSVFIGYGVVRAVSSTDDCSIFTNALISVLGIMLWVVTLSSFLQNHVRPVGSADLSTVTLALCEFWIAVNQGVKAHGRGC